MVQLENFFYIKKNPPKIEKKGGRITLNKILDLNSLNNI